MTSLTASVMHCARDYCNFQFKTPFKLISIFPANASISMSSWNKNELRGVNHNSKCHSEFEFQFSPMTLAYQCQVQTQECAAEVSFAILIWVSIFAANANLSMSSWDSGALRPNHNSKWYYPIRVVKNYIIDCRITTWNLKKKKIQIRISIFTGDGLDANVRFKFKNALRGADPNSKCNCNSQFEFQFSTLTYQYQNQEWAAERR